MRMIRSPFLSSRGVASAADVAAAQKTMSRPVAANPVPNRRLARFHIAVRSSGTEGASGDGRRCNAGRPGPDAMSRPGALSIPDHAGQVGCERAGGRREDHATALYLVYRSRTTLSKGAPVSSGGECGLRSEDSESEQPSSLRLPHSLLLAALDVLRRLAGQCVAAFDGLADGCARVRRGHIRPLLDLLRLI